MRVAPRGLDVPDAATASPEMRAATHLFLYYVRPPPPPARARRLQKALVLKDRLHAIIPGAEIDARVSMFRAEDADSLLDITDTTGVAGGGGGAPAPPGACFVLDCIDDLVTKAELIAQCSKKGLRVLSSMGAGLKSDPTRLHIAKLADCCKDRLAMRVCVSVSVSVAVSVTVSERARDRVAFAAKRSSSFLPSFLPSLSCRLSREPSLLLFSLRLT